MKPSHAPGQFWTLREDGVDYVRTLNDDLVCLRVDGKCLDVDRETARLLALSTLRCLKDTAQI